MVSEKVKSSVLKRKPRLRINNYLLPFDHFWQRPSLVTLFIGGWVLAMVSLPIIKWIWGPEALPLGLTLGVTLQATAVFLLLLNRWGWPKTVGTAVLVAGLTLLVEWLGSTTGFPFGQYSYTDLMQPQILHVPVLIPFAWFMMLPSAWTVSTLIQNRLPVRWQNSRWLYAALAALAFTAWDLLLDPQMVAWGLWAWENPGGYFGIPWSNYAGWLGTAFLLTVLIHPKNLPTRPLFLIYAVTWFLETFGLLLFWELVGPALVGGGLMGLFVWLGWRSAISRA